MPPRGQPKKPPSTAGPGRTNRRNAGAGGQPNQQGAEAPSTSGQAAPTSGPANTGQPPPPASQPPKRKRGATTSQSPQQPKKRARTAQSPQGQQEQQGQEAPEGQEASQEQQGQEASQGQQAPEGQEASQGQEAPPGPQAPQGQEAPPGQQAPEGQEASQGQEAPPGQQAPQALQARYPGDSDIHRPAPPWAQGVLGRPPPVSRPQAYPPNGQAAPPLPTTRTQRNQRIEALRNQIRFPHGGGHHTLSELLTWARWDVNRAAAVYWENQNNPQAIGLTTPTWNRAADNVEQTRLRILHDMQQGLRSRQRTTLHTSNPNMALLLQRNSWDLDEASRDIAARDASVADPTTNGAGQASNSTAPANNRSDPFEDLTERVTGMRGDPDGDPSRDQRLAEFLTITSTNSVDAARRMLEKFKYDLARAIDEWIRQGGLRVEANDITLRSWNPNRPRRVINGRFEHYDDEMPPQVPPEPMVPGTETLDTLARPQNLRRRDLDNEPGREYGTERGRNSRRGYVIDEDRRPAARGAPDESRLRIEYIRQGQLRTIYFGRPAAGDNDGRIQHNYNFSDSPDASLNEFDWNDPSHITNLNRWRAERFRAITGETVRDEPVPFNKYELSWLTEQEGMRIEETFWKWAAQNQYDPNITDQTKYEKARDDFETNTTFPIPLTAAEKTSLADRFNETFAGRYTYLKWNARLHPADTNPQTILPDGTHQLRHNILWEAKVKDMSRVGVVPRPHREENMINQQRKRIKAHCKHFGLTYEYGNADNLESEPDSDFERQ
ncbi:hypothetical protein H2202_001796 [Exophiala xenobiotica]|nr:hypothetical protein H2202_001796 [Exophiala xenobiotica]